MELLSNLDLEYYCIKLKIKLNAVINKNLLKTITPKKGCYIINLQDSHEGSGTHWCCFIIFDTTVTYFDPFGVIPPTNVISFARRFQKEIRIIYSADKIQDLNSIYCGWFNLWFLYYMNTHKCDKKGILLNRHNAQYDLQNEKRNDEKIKELIEGVFRNKI